MSVQSDQERPAIELPNHGDLAFGALMDALAPEPETAGEGVPGAAGADAGQGGAQPASGGGSAAAGGAAPVADGGDQSSAPAGGTAASGGGDGSAGSGQQGSAPGTGTPAAGSAEQPATDGAGAALPADWTATAEEYLPKLGELSTKIEESITQAFQQQAYDQAREEYENYFVALEKHPRLLVGAQVPAIGKEGMETLRNSEDAKEWQEAVRGLLVQEIRETAQSKLDEAQDYLEILHTSIDLFKNNKDLIPGTKNFDRELADQFASLAQPYEIRVEDKLQGYSIPVQPIIDSLRKQLVDRRKAAPAAGVQQAGVPSGTPGKAQSKAEPPQAGLQSKAGISTEREDFSTLFGTIGLPNLQI